MMNPDRWPVNVHLQDLSRQERNRLHAKKSRNNKKEVMCEVTPVDDITTSGHRHIHRQRHRYRAPSLPTCWYHTHPSTRLLRQEEDGLRVRIEQLKEENSMLTVQIEGKETDGTHSLAPTRTVSTPELLAPAVALDDMEAMAELAMAELIKAAAQQALGK